MSEVREAVRSRYEDAAKQLTVLANTGAELEPGCCRADGPDCGCGGAYSSDELAGVGLTDAVSLGCGNPLLLAQLQPGDSVLDLGSGPGQPARRSPGGTDRQGGRRRSVPGDGREGPPQRRIAGPAQRRVRERRDRNVASAGGDGWWANTSAASGSNGQPVSEEAIRLCAYQRWEAAGKPGGDGLKFWLEAEQELSHAK